MPSHVRITGSRKGSAKLTFTGQKAMKAKMQRIINKYPKTVERALRIEAEKIIFRAQKLFVPVDLGDLRDSGFVDEPKRKGFGLSKDITIKLGFGGPKAPYAVVVHEHPSVISPPSWQGKIVEFRPLGTGPKYLEKPFKSAQRGMRGRIAAMVIF